MPEQPLEPELMALEQSLAQLEPAARLSREQLFFQAGKASARWRWTWPAATGVSTLAAMILGILLWRQSTVAPVAPQIQYIYVDRFVPVSPEQPPQSVDVLSSNPQVDSSAQDYLKLRQNVVRWGTDVLHAPPPQMGTQEKLTPADVPRLSSPQSVWQGILHFIPLSSGGDS